MTGKTVLLPEKSKFGGSVIELEQFESSMAFAIRRGQCMTLASDSLAGR